MKASNLLEDLTFLEGTGFGLIEAAARTDFPTAEALYAWLGRNGHADLRTRLRDHDPIGTSPTNGRRTMTDPVQQILDHAAESSKAATRRKAGRATALIEELRTTIKAEQAEAEQRAAAQAEVDRLSAKLAEAKAKPRGSTRPASAAVGVPAPEIRAWAQLAGMPCPERGKVPAVVREAYEAEHGIGDDQ